jgi:hypothetical protein
VRASVNSDFIIGVRFRDLKGNFVYSANDIKNIHQINGVQCDKFIVSTEVKIPLAHNDYVISTAIFGFNDGKAFLDGVYDYGKAVIWEQIEDAAYLKVHPFKLMPLVGPVNTCMELNIEKIN